MNKKHMVFGLLFFAVLVLSIPDAAIASDAQYEAYNLTIQPGTDETELSFTWFTKDPSEKHQLVVFKEGMPQKGKFPQKEWMRKGGKFTKWMNVYDADIVEEIYVETQSGGGGFGPGGRPEEGDSDGDRVSDEDDNCPDDSNSDQADVDEDGIGDVCDPDIDNDELLNEDDNCPYIANYDQVDVDEDGSGDECDNCPDTANEYQADMDEDGAGDACDKIYACTVTIPNLRNNTKYAYAVGNGESFSDIHYFSTENANNYNFIFVGDPQIGASGDADRDAAGWMETVTAALEEFKNTSFIFSAGDQVETSTSFSEYDGFFSAGELTSLPFAPTVGNHDTSILYAYHFNVPNLSELGESTDRSGNPDGAGGDYWFTYGPALFMVLNSNNDSATSHDEFMAQAIEANPRAKWRVVVFHHSIYSSASHVDDVNGRRTTFYPVIDKYDIDVVLSGHDHFYARTYQLSGGLIAESEEPEEACYTTIDGRSGEEKEVCIDLIGDVVEEDDLHYTMSGKVLNPDGTVYITANSASGSKYYDFTDIDGYTNLYLAAYEQLYTPTYLNVEVNRFTFTISAYYIDEETGESVMFDTYSILKTRTFGWNRYDLGGWDNHDRGGWNNHDWYDWNDYDWGFDD